MSTQRATYARRPVAGHRAPVPTYADEMRVVAALTGVVVVKGGLEQLTDDAKGKLALELAPARGEDPDVLLRRRGAELGEEPALPDPGGTFHQRKPPLAAHGVGQCSTKRFKLAVTLEEQLCPARLVHGTGTS